MDYKPTRTETKTKSACTNVAGCYSFPSNGVPWNTREGGLAVGALISAIAFGCPFRALQGLLRGLNRHLQRGQQSPLAVNEIHNDALLDMDRILGASDDRLWIQSKINDQFFGDPVTRQKSSHSMRSRLRRELGLGRPVVGTLRLC